MFGRNKYDIPVVIFKQASSGFTAIHTVAMQLNVKGNMRLKLKRGILIKMDEMSRIGNTYYTATPDDKVYFPVRINFISADLVKKIKQYENDHIAELEEIDKKENLSIDEKQQKKDELLSNALSKEEKELLSKYGMSFDILPDPTAYEIAQQQIEEAYRVNAKKKKDKWEKLMPILTIVGISIAFAIMAYATVSYTSSVATSVSPIVSGLNSVAANLKSIVTSLGTSAAHSVANSTIPSP